MQTFGPLTDEEKNRIKYHKPTEAKVARHETMRAAALAYMETIAKFCPYGRHLSLALTAAQESLMWANAAIACDSPDE